MRKVDILRGKLEKLVHLLTEKKIKVTNRGSEVFVEYDARSGNIKRMNLPYISDDATEEFMEAIEGYLDHEVGHVLFTEQRLMVTARKTPFLPAIFNAVEDSYIERKMIERFAGSKYNIGKTADLFKKVYLDPAVAQNGDEFEMASTLLVPAIRAWSGDVHFAGYMEDKWHLVPTLVLRLEKYAKTALPKIQSTKESLEVAKKLLSLLTDLLPEQDGGAGEGEEKSEDGAGGFGQDDPDNNQENTDNSQSNTDNGQGNGDDDGTEQKDEDGDKSSEDRGKVKSGEGDSDEDREAEEATGNPNKPKNGKGKLFVRKCREDDFAEALKDHINGQSKAMSKDYCVYTTDFDEFKAPDTTTTSTGDVTALENSVNGVLGVIQKKLERAVSAKSMAVWSGGYRSGRINATSLSRLVVKQDDRVFKRKHVANTKDTAVSLLVDCSGSMTNGNKISTACKTAFAFSTVLERMNIKNEVLGFTTGNHISKFVRRTDPKAKDFNFGYSRSEILRTYIFKLFDERLVYEQKKRLACAMTHRCSLENNVDGESVMIAANRLLQRKEARKILIVLSDGLPNACGHLNYGKALMKTVKYIEKETPIDLVAIGINSDAVKRFYSNFVVLNNVDDLPKTCIDELSKLLLK